MTYKLFIDDERNPPISWCDEPVKICRSSSEAISCISMHGIPDFISFDHDLGGEDTAIKVINWLENSCIEHNLRFSESFEFYVHSQNPVGAENIQYRMQALIKHFSRKNK